jgi:outer membrane protein assembly factor BamB
MIKLLLGVVLISQFVMPALCSAAGVDVLVGRYDKRGTGANLHESVLNTSNVNPSSFGKLFSYEVEGFVYAQPLIVSGISVNGHPRNLVYVATTNNMVYALDADDPGPEGGLLWQVRLTDHGAFPAPSIDKTGLTVQGNIGILSTPVIDRARGAIYVVARSLGSGGYLQRLHALDLLTGRDKAGSPVDISHVSVIRDGITFTFDPKVQSNRAGLTLSGSKVIIAWSGLDGDHGWVMAYDAETLQRTGIFCTTCARAVPFADTDADPQAHSGPSNCFEPPEPWLIGGGIWQSGRPPVVDAQGHVYYFVANGWTHGCVGKTFWYATACSFGQQKPSGYYGESLLKLDPNNGLALVGSWTPATWCKLELHDNDLGGSGPVLIDFALPGDSTRTFAVGGGKEGRLYSIDTGLVTHPDMVEGQTAAALRGDFHVVFNGPLLPCVQSHPTAHDQHHHVMGGPVFWPRSAEGLVSLFLSVESDCVRGFGFASSRMLGHVDNLIDPNPITFTSQLIEGHPGAILSLSANGDRNGVLWMAYALNPPEEGRHTRY